MTDGLTPADISAVMGNNRDNGGIFGGDGAWWIIVLFIFAFMGWGGNGLGGRGTGVNDNYVLSSDFSTLSRQIDTATDGLRQQSTGIANGLCDGFYTQAQLVNGVNTNILQNSNAIQSQLASCCCENREAIAQVRYDMATQNCATNSAIATSTRDIIESQNSNTRAILDALTAQAIASKDDKIAEQNQQIFALQLSASQQAQNAYLINQLAPKLPTPAYTVPNPFGGCPYNN